MIKIPEKFINNLRYRIIKFLEKFGYYHPVRKNYKKLVFDFYLKELFDTLEKVEGNIVECGVAYGDSLITLGILAKQERKGRIVYGFDSFEGFPEPTLKDYGPRKPKKGEYKDATLQRINKIIRVADIPFPHLIKGFFENTLKDFQKKIALLHIDADLYQSYKTVLQELHDKVSHGGIIAFDEYGDTHWPGDTQAVNEFLEKYGKLYELKKARYIEKYYLVKKRCIFLEK